MEQHLRVFVNYQQDDWTHWLPMAEFAMNNDTSQSTVFSPFFGNYSFHLRMTFGPHPVQNGKDIMKVNANVLSKK
jgi:hypothetical protein